MDPVTPLGEERGQALVVAVLVVGVAAAAVVGLLGAQERMIEGVRDARAGEAAAEAAGAAIADLAFGQVAADAERDPQGQVTRGPGGPDRDAFIRDPRVADSARVAAEQLAAANGRGAPTDLTIGLSPHGIVVGLRLAGRRHEVEVSCCPR